MTRETIFSALKTKLDALVTAGTLKTCSRNFIPIADIADTQLPALFIVETGNNAINDKGTPPIYDFGAGLILYTSRGNYNEASNPASSVYNPIIDAIYDTLQPDAIDGFQTLGGTVSHCWIKSDNIIDGFQNDRALITFDLSIMPNTNNITTSNQYIFDSGYLYGVPLDAVDKTPIKFGSLKGITIDLKVEHEYAKNQFRIHTNAATKLKSVKGNAKLGSINGEAFSRIFFQQAVSGTAQTWVSEQKTIPSVSAYTITISATIVTDLGVLTDTGGTYTYTTGSPASGQYSRSGSVYTFNVADKGKVVYISYVSSTASGKKIPIANEYNYVPQKFLAVFVGLYNGKQINLVLNSCITTSFVLPTSIERFTVCDFDFEALADSSNNLGALNFS